MIEGVQHSAEFSANHLIELHGRHAHQVLVDAIVRAVREGDDEQVNRLDRVMRVMERRTREFR